MTQLSRRTQEPGPPKQRDLTKMKRCSGTKTRLFFEGFFLQKNGHLSSLRRSECQMYCWAQSYRVFFVFLGVTLDGAETSFAKTPFSWSLRGLTGCPRRKVATLKIRKSASDALNKGSGALGKVKESCRPLGGAPPKNSMKKGFPEGPQRHLNAARQKLSRDNFCRSIAAQ